MDQRWERSTSQLLCTNNGPNTCTWKTRNRHGQSLVGPIPTSIEGNKNVLHVKLVRNAESDVPFAISTHSQENNHFPFSIRDHLFWLFMTGHQNRHPGNHIYAVELLGVRKTRAKSGTVRLRKRQMEFQSTEGS